MTGQSAKEFNEAALVAERAVLAAIMELERVYPFIEVRDIRINRVDVSTLGEGRRSALQGIDISCYVVRS